MVDMGIGHKTSCQIDVDNFLNVMKKTNDKQSRWHVDMLVRWNVNFICTCL